VAGGKNLKVKENANLFFQTLTQNEEGSSISPINLKLNDYAVKCVLIALMSLHWALQSAGNNITPLTCI
jgi:hypothetical protein